MPMNFPPSFVLLALAIVLVWLPAMHVGDRRLPPWTLAFVAACVAGALASPPVLAPIALASLAMLAAIVWAGATAPRGRTALTALAAFMALAMSVHLLPDFRQVGLFHDICLTPDAAPFVLALNFDKGAAGLLLLAAFSPRVSS
jgi:hypothetical protein